MKEWGQLKNGHRGGWKMNRWLDGFRDTAADRMYIQIPCFAVGQ